MPIDINDLIREVQAMQARDQAFLANVRVDEHIPAQPQQIPVVPPPEPPRPDRNKFDPDVFPRLKQELREIKDSYPRVRFHPVGSYETSTAEFQDIDILCLIPEENLEALKVFLTDGDWVRERLAYEGQPEFTSFRTSYDDLSINLLVTGNVDFAAKFMRGAVLCKHLNLRNKADRILVHEMFRQGRVQQNIWEIEV